MRTTEGSDVHFVNQSRVDRLIFNVCGAIVIAVAIAAATLALVSFNLIRELLDGYSGDGTADAYTLAIHRRLQTFFCSIAIFLSCTSAIVFYQRSRVVVLLEKFRKRITCELRDCLKQLTSVPPWAWLMVLLVSTSAVVVPLAFINEPIRYDEAYTYLNYASEPLFRTVTRYDAPNNHVFHSIMANFSLRVFGDNLAALRLPALVGEVGLVLLTFSAAAALTGYPMAFCSAALLVALPTVTESAVNARGYTLAAACFMLCVLMMEISKRKRIPLTSWLVLFAGTSLMLYTVPTMIYGWWMLSAWALLSTKHRLRLNIVAALFAGLCLAAVLYLPILLTNPFQDLQAVLSGSHGGRLVMLEESVNYWHSVWQWLFWDVPCLIQISLAIAICICLMSALRCYNERTKIWLSVGSVLPLCLLLGVWPPERIWLFVLPLALFAALDGSNRLFGAVLQPKTHGSIICATCVFALWMFGTTLSQQHIRSTNRHAVVRNAAEVATWLHENSTLNRPILTVTPASGCVIYHFKHQGWSLKPFDEPQLNDHTLKESWLVTNAEFSQSPIDILRELGLKDRYDASHATLIRQMDATKIWGSFLK